MCWTMIPGHECVLVYSLCIVRDFYRIYVLFGAVAELEIYFCLCSQVGRLFVAVIRTSLACQLFKSPFTLHVLINLFLLYKIIYDYKTWT